MKAPTKGTSRSATATPIMIRGCLGLLTRRSYNVALNPLMALLTAAGNSSSRFAL